MRQIRFRLGLRLRPRWGSLQRFFRLLSLNLWVLLLRAEKRGRKGGEKNGKRGGKGRKKNVGSGKAGKERKDGEEKDVEAPHQFTFLASPIAPSLRLHNPTAARAPMTPYRL